MLTRKSFRKSFLGLIFVVTFISSIILGLSLANNKNFAIDLTRTAMVEEIEMPIVRLIEATQTMIVVQTEIAKIQMTQTYIADTKAAIDSYLQSTATPPPK